MTMGIIRRIARIKIYQSYPKKVSDILNKKEREYASLIFFFFQATKKIDILRFPVSILVNVFGFACIQWIQEKSLQNESILLHPIKHSV